MREELERDRHDDLDRRDQPEVGSAPPPGAIRSATPRATGRVGIEPEPSGDFAVENTLPDPDAEPQAGLDAAGVPFGRGIPLSGHPWGTRSQTRRPWSRTMRTMRESAAPTVEPRRGREPGAAAHDGRSNDQPAGVGLP